MSEHGHGHGHREHGERTRWQHIQDSKIRRIETKIKTLPKMIGEAVRLGPLYELRTIVDDLDYPPHPTSLHKHTVTGLAELEYALDSLQVVTLPVVEASCRECGHGVGYHTGRGCIEGDPDDH